MVNNLLNPPARIENRTLKIQQFNFTVKHKPGKFNIADYLSRYPSRSLNIDSELYEECAKKTERHVKMLIMTNVPKGMTLSEVEIESRNDSTLTNLRYFGWYKAH